MKKLFTLCFLVAILFNANAQNLVRFDSDGKVGFKDSDGHIIVAADYKYPADFHDGLLQIKVNDRYGFIDSAGKIVIPCIYELASIFTEGIAYGRLTAATKFALIDKSGKQLTPFKYEYLSPCSNGVTLSTTDGKRGFINSEGVEITPFIYERGTQSFSEGLAVVKLDNKYGYIDQTGEAVIPIFLDYAQSFYKGVAIVKIISSLAIIDKKGKTLKTLKYNSISRYPKEDVVNVELDKKYGRINIETGKEIFPPIYDEIESFEEDFSSWAKLNNKWGVIDKKGKVIIPIQYDYKDKIYETNNCFKVKKDNKYGLLDAANRKELTETKYDSIGRFNDGFAMIKVNNKYGFIAMSGEELKQPSLDFVRDFSDDVAIVYNLNQWFVFDKNGKELPLINKEGPQYENIESFNYGLARVTNLGKKGYINKSGKVIISLIYDKAVDTFYDSIAVLLNNKQGIFDYTGNEIIPVIYDNISIGRGGVTKAVLDGKEFYFDKKGKPIAKPQ